MKKKWVSAISVISLLVVVLTDQLCMPAHARQPNRVGLVVVHGDGSTSTRCIEFNESEISGYDVLQRSGLKIVAAQDSGAGAAVCAIDGEGCPKGSCLTCDMPNYWSYWHLEGSAWTYSPVGASLYKAHNGDVEGWRWGGGDPPPVVPFDQICAAPPTDVPPPTETPMPVTDTPIPPTDTPAPPTPMVWFRLDENPIEAGSCTAVRWDTADVVEVYLDGERVDPNGSRGACPTASQEYHLRVVSAAGEQTHTLVLGVTGAPPTTATSLPTSPTPTATPAPVAAADSASLPTLTPSPTPTATPQPVAAGASSPPTATPTVPTATPFPTDDALKPTAAAQPLPPGDPAQSSPSGGSYVVFGGIATGLAGLLVLLMRRRR
jgi:hypothetical protein